PHDSGLVSGGVYRVVTDLAILGFDEESKHMMVIALHPGVSPEQVRDNTGFDLAIDPGVRITEPPSDRELAVVRELDPGRLYTA
ncbi:MAG: 3-oxoadipate--succinyl-CoA transferase subunit B, partial [Alphaproteobacteria bacterium]